MCGEFLSDDAVSSLDALGLRAEVESEAEPIHRGELFVPGADSIPFRLP